MRKLILLLFLLPLLALPARAKELTAPVPPDEALDLLPDEPHSFGEDLFSVIMSAISAMEPELADAAGVCGAVIATGLLISLVKAMPGGAIPAVELTGTVVVAVILLQSTQSMIHLAADTVQELSQYGKLLIPVMTTALAAQGGVTASASLYAGTALFDAVLCGLIAGVLVPLVYVFLVFSLGAEATENTMLQKLRDFVKWLTSWALKTILYIFTGYIGITRVVSGTTDASALKAAKLTVSGMVPVVGGILSDASEAMLVGAGLMKNTIGIYGMLVVIALWISPFLQIGCQYLLLKLTGTLCEVFEVKRVTGMVKAFTTAMGLLLAMTASVCMLLLISVVCFLKGVG